MTEQRVSKKAMDVPESVQQSARDRGTLTLRDAVATRGLTVKTHLKAGKYEDITITNGVGLSK
jgi:hypothetical protein